MAAFGWPANQEKDAVYPYAQVDAEGQKLRCDGRFGETAKTIAYIDNAWGRPWTSAPVASAPLRRRTRHREDGSPGQQRKFANGRFPAFHFDRLAARSKGA